VPRHAGHLLEEGSKRSLEDHQGLYLEFAALPEEADAICHFANQHGHLGGVVTGRTKISGRNTPVESLEIWSEEINAMRDLLEDWNRIRPGPSASRPKAARAVSSPQVEFAGFPDLSKAFRGGDHLHPAIERLDLAYKAALDAVLVDADEAQPVQSAIGFFGVRLSRYLRELTPPTVRWVTTSHQFQLSLAPTSLLGAMWAQFASAVIGGAQFRACKECSSLFEVCLQTSSGARSDRVYCSDKCRQKAFRDRQRVARRRPSRRKG
jgi:hypothetical protein